LAGLDIHPSTVSLLHSSTGIALATLLGTKYSSNLQIFQVNFNIFADYPVKKINGIIEYLTSDEVVLVEE